MVPPCLHRIDDRAQAFADFSQRVFDVLAGTDVRTISVRFGRNGQLRYGFCVLDVRFSRIGQFMAMASGQRTRKTMMMIMAKPVRSVKVNVSPAHATAVMVAMTGSLVPSMVARTAPTRITPAM